MSNQVKISIDTANEIINKIEAIKSIVAGLIGILITDDDIQNKEDPDNPNFISTARYFVVNKKILVDTFANAISEEFTNIKDYLQDLEKFRDLNWTKASTRGPLSLLLNKDNLTFITHTQEILVFFSKLWTKKRSQI